MISDRVTQNNFFVYYNSKAHQNIKQRALNLGQNIKSIISNGHPNQLIILNKLNDIATWVQKRINDASLTQIDLDRYKNELDTLLGATSSSQSENIKTFFHVCIILSKHNTTGETKLNYFGITNKTISIEKLSETNETYPNLEPLEPDDIVNIIGEVITKPQIEVINPHAIRQANTQTITTNEYQAHSIIQNHKLNEAHIPDIEKIISSRITGFKIDQFIISDAFQQFGEKVNIIKKFDSEFKLFIVNFNNKPSKIIQLTDSGFKFVDPLTTVYVAKNAENSLERFGYITNNCKFSNSTKGLFAECVIHGGVFYREFSQAIGSNDLEIYFSQDSKNPILKSGICAGCGYYWLIYYLTDHSAPYNNNILKTYSQNILKTQEILRLHDQPLQNLLLLSGFKPNIDLFDQEINQKNKDIMIEQISSFPGCGTISYNDPAQGRHVTTFFVDETLNLFFSDIHKGDVFIPFPGSTNWLRKYCDIFLSSCSTLIISQFATTEYNKTQMLSAQDSISRGFMPVK